MNICIPRKSSKGLGDFGVTKTQTHLQKFTDINNMISRAIAGDNSVFRKGSYVDVSQCPDTMQELLNAQCRARDSYEMLPDEVKKRFPSPNSLLEAVSNPERLKELIDLGLAIERKPEGPIEVKVVSAPSTAVSTTAPAPSNT